MTVRRTPATRKPNAKKRATRTPKKKIDVTPDSVIEIKQEYDPQWHATVEAYVTLRNAGAPIPDSIRKPVEDWLAKEEEKARKEAAKEAEAAAKRKKADDVGPKWVRNRYHSDVVLPLHAKDKDRKVRLELKPRGRRGDLHPLQKDDLEDHTLIEMANRGFVEIIGQTEAADIVDKQTTNIRRSHTPLAILTNERGEKPEDGFKLDVETEYNKQGVTVAHILKNEKGETNPRDPFGALRRSQFVPTGEHATPQVSIGNPAIFSDGFNPQAQGENITAAIQDDIARRAKGAARTGEGLRPEQALGLNVSVEPVRKT